MGRKKDDDGYDAADEHDDIHELRRVLRDGGTIGFAGKPAKRRGLCGVLAFLAVAAPIVAAVAAVKGIG